MFVIVCPRTIAQAGVLRVSVAGLLALLVSPALAFEDAADPASSLAEASIEQLMNVRVTSVSKKEQSLASTASAVFVISSDDIRRSGATNIPDLLRRVPGMFVGQIDSTKWAISTRGNAGEFSNKMLVLVDGRSVYSPMYAGVFWDTVDMPLEDIERIEVIRGPGTTVWGANAVNGVINIITKRAEATPGFSASATVSSDDRFTETLQYGGRSGRTAYRIFERSFDRRPLVSTTALSNSEWTAGRAGFRTDTALSERSELTFIGEGYTYRSTDVMKVPTPTPPYMHLTFNEESPSGGFLLSRFTHRTESSGSWTVQSYVDAALRPGRYSEDTAYTADLDVENRRRAGQRNEVVWGGGVREYRTRGYADGYASKLDRWHHSTLFSGFLEDQWELVPEKLSLTAGSKLEHNEYTGFEVQPSARLMFTPHRGQSIWFAQSHGVRMPSRMENDVQTTLFYLPISSEYLVQGMLLGNSEFQSEVLYATEAGYRLQSARHFSIDTAAYYNRYNGWQTARVGAPVFPAAGSNIVTVPLTFINGGRATVAGAEAWATVLFRGWGKLQAGYSFRRTISDDGRIDRPAELSNFVVPSVPEHQWTGIWSVDFRRGFSFDAMAYRVSALTDADVPGYTRLDIRIARRMTPACEVSLTGQNLLQSHHLEYISEGFTVADQERRALVGHVSWRF